MPRERYKVSAKGCQSCVRLSIFHKLNINSYPKKKIQDMGEQLLQKVVFMHQTQFFPEHE